MNTPDESTPEEIEAARRFMSPRGTIFLPTPEDVARYASLKARDARTAECERLLAIMRDEGSSVYERHALGNGKRLTHADGSPIPDRTAELCDMARAKALVPVSEGEVEAAAAASCQAEDEIRPPRIPDDGIRPWEEQPDDYKEELRIRARAALNVFLVGRRGTP